MGGGGGRGRGGEGGARGNRRGVGRRLEGRMDWGVKEENTGPDAASALAR